MSRHRRKRVRRRHIAARRAAARDWADALRRAEKFRFYGFTTVEWKEKT